MADYTLWHGDCLEQMDRIESGSIDAIICDLPFGRTACAWDVVIPFEPLWKQYKRVIKKRGAVVLFGASPFNYILYASNPQWFKYDWAWYKNTVTGAGNANYQPMRCKEEILVFSNGTPNFNKQPTKSPVTDRKLGGKNGTNGPSEHYPFVQVKSKILKEWVNPRNVLEFDIEPLALGRLHPTQKPVALLSYLIKTYTNEGETVLDNTMGSGSTGEACLRTGRRFIGIEKDAHYYQVASDRLARVAAELRGELTHLPMFQGVTP